MKLPLNLILTIACTGNLLLNLPTQAMSLTSPSSKRAVVAPRLQPTEIEEWKVKNIASQITVRVFSADNSGSGIVINSQERKLNQQSVYLYLVLTNDHVAGDPNTKYSIETPDGRIHKASLYPDSKKRFSGYDLGLLWFYSPLKYDKATLDSSNPSNLKNLDQVFVSGFPCEGRFCEKIGKLTFNFGEVLLLPKPLINGYELGYTSKTEPGTSGGPVLNKKGEVVGINGKGRYPQSNRQYTYLDGDKPSTEVQNFMQYFAWGIPIKFYTQLAPENPFEKLPLSNDDLGSTLTNPSQQQNQQAVHNSMQSVDDKYKIVLVVIVLLSILSFSFVSFLVGLYLSYKKGWQSDPKKVMLFLAEKVSCYVDEKKKKK